MTRTELEEMLNDKVYLRAPDLMKIFDCGQGKAYGFINAIKLHSDTLTIQGKVTVTDFRNWFSRNDKQESANQGRTS